MKKLLFIISIIFTSYSIFAQDTQEPQENFILLKKGEYILGDKISDNIFRGKSIKMDGVSYPFSKVIGYKKKGEFYGNYKNKKFLRRVNKAAISMYVEVKTRTSVSNGVATTRKSVKEYIQKGTLGELQEFDYANVRKMIRDDKSAMKVIKDYASNKKKAKNYFITAVGSFIGGGVMGFASLLRVADGKKAPVHTATSAALFSGSITTFMLGGFKSMKNKKNLLLSVLIFNKNHPLIDDNLKVSKSEEEKAMSSENDNTDEDTNNKKSNTVIKSNGAKKSKKHLKKYESSEEKYAKQQEKIDNFSDKGKQKNLALEVGINGYFGFPKAETISVFGQNEEVKVGAMGWGINLYPKYLIKNTQKMSVSFGLPLTLGLSKYINAEAMVDANFGLFAKENQDAKMGGFIGVGGGYYTTAAVFTTHISGYEEYFPTINGFGPTIHAGIGFKISKFSLLTGKGKTFVNGYRVSFKPGNSKSNNFLTLTTFYKF